MKFCALLGQVTRFSVVGLTSNLVLYLAYLELTSLGWGHKIAMSTVYVVGVLQSFILQKKWTFSHHGHLSVTFVRYFSLFAAGYVINLGFLIVMVDRLGYSHEWVQGMMLLVIGVLLFIMQKAWVFRSLGIKGA